MDTETLRINPYLFEQHFLAFKSFVEHKSGMAFVSFDQNPYTYNQESYKSKIQYEGRKELDFQSWLPSDIGSGLIAEKVTGGIEIKENNLVQWDRRYGDEGRQHQPLYDAQPETPEMNRIENTLFALYRTNQDKQTFAELVDIFGRRYPILAYLYLLKDRTSYLPIAPTYFDFSFDLLGVSFKTSHQCSWENYSIYLSLIREIKGLLSDQLESDVTLLDAHSFAWMLSRQMQKENVLPDVNSYFSLPATEREAIVKARVGQGRFRQALIDYWGSCAVTGCEETTLLRASHIRPWAGASVEDRLSLFNGLLLSPAVDACFDAGFISVNDDGAILISDQLSTDDTEALGIRSDMRLARVEPEHRP